VRKKQLANAQEILEVLMANETRADLVTLFRKNPGLIDSLEGVARRIGRSQSAIQDDIAELVKLGVLKSRKLGANEVISIDRMKDKEIQDEVGSYLQNLKPQG
jgi:predicted transcriptional regulator